LGTSRDLSRHHLAGDVSLGFFALDGGAASWVGYTQVRAPVLSGGHFTG
jgi:hypothetical protein